MSFSINGITAATLNVELSEAPGTLVGFGREIPSTPINLRDGEVRTTARLADAARELQLVGVVKGTSAAVLRTRMDTLVAALTPSSALLILDDQPGRRHVVTCTRLQVQPIGPQFVALQAAFAATFKALTPFAEDVTATTVSGITTTPVALPLGTGIVRPVITITGAATNPILTLRNSSGVTIGTMNFTGLSLGAGIPLVIDCEALTVKNNGTPAPAALAAGDFFALDVAAQGVYASSAWPTLACSSGTAVASYRRTWR